MDDQAKFLLRITVGFPMLFHGIAKFNGIGFISGTLAGIGLPEIIANGVYIGEVLAPLMVIVGLYTRIGGWLMAINMLFAIGLMHSQQIFTLTEQGAWAIELQVLYLSAAVVIALLGSGKFALKAD
jgi:putative oxidoreductase